MQPEQKVNILLVDDHPENLLALEALLESLGQNLISANSGEEALKHVLRQDFALILLDVQMPGMDGFETAALIRSRPSSQQTPIIFLTAFSKSEEFVFKGYALGAVDYLFKPIEPDILKSKVTVFVELYQKTAEVKRQAAQLERMNAELKQSEERFRCVSASSPVGIFVTDNIGRCTYINPRCQDIFGFQLKESFSQAWLQSVHPEDRDRIVADWLSWRRTEQEYATEFRLLAPEQKIVRWVHLQSSPMFSDQNNLMGHVATVEDITERKLAEANQAQLIREQAAREQAEIANRMKDEFLATLSHELRTPLNSMLGWARLLRTRNFDQKTTARALETIERNAKLQAQLIEDILDVSRIIRGKIRLHICPVNLESVVVAALDTLRPAAEAKAIELCNNIEELHLTSQQPSFMVCGDLDRLQQVVWNLLSNAIKFTPEGGRVEVRLSTVDSYNQIQVSDTGIGIARDFLPYIFERFRQADSSITRSYGGLGLGLAIVRHLIELHGGVVYAESEGEGQGATFTIKLPIIKASNEVVGIPSLPEEKTSDIPLLSAEPKNRDMGIVCLNGLNILIVDDEPDIRELLAIALEQYGAKVTAFSSSALALESFEQLHPNVIISDIGMPHEDGYKLIGKLREIEAQHGWKIPAVALTAYVSQEDFTQALAAGFQMHISKPVDTTELVSALAKLVQQD